MAVSPAEVEKYLKGMDYPTRKPDLIKQAQQNGAPADVSKAIGEMK